MEDLEYEIKNDYLNLVNNLVNNLENLSVDDFYEYGNYFADCEILNYIHIKKNYIN